MRIDKVTSQNKALNILLITGFLIAGFALTYMLTGGNKQNVVAAECRVESCVALKAEGAVPSEISVKVGSSVQFNSADGKTHSLSLGSGGEEHEHKGKFSSGDFKGDEAWKVEFKEEGTFTFHDHYNPEINVLVVVYQPGKEYKL